MSGDVTNFKRIVLKIGTNMLSKQSDHANISPRGRDAGPLDIEYMHRIAQQIATLMRAGKQILLVTSGAIGMGAQELGISRRVTEIEMRQACAAIGQPMLMEEYRKVFGIYGITVAQILITRDDWNKRMSYLNLKNSIETLLEMRVLPIFNENDTISTAEIGNAFGDNDQLSAYIASKIDAELLVLLTDIDALYTANPKDNPNAKPIHYVERLNSEIWSAAGDHGSEFSTGGMKTKLKAVEIAQDAGCKVVLAHGRTPDLLTRLVSGEAIGTLFEAASPLKNRTRWIKNASAQGSIQVDEGAMNAIQQKNSLLPRGILKVAGVFDRGSIIIVNNTVKMLTGFSSQELEDIRGQHSQEIAKILGPDLPTVIARPEDMAFMNENHE